MVTRKIASTQDFRQWTMLGSTNSVTGGPIVYAVADPALYPRRFYRVSKQ
jgi:hypothetical protein